MYLYFFWSYLLCLYYKIEEQIVEWSKPYLEVFWKYSIESQIEKLIGKEEKEEEEKYEEKYLKEYKNLSDLYVYMDEDLEYEIKTRELLRLKNEEKMEKIGIELKNLAVIFDKGELGENVKELVRYYNLDVDEDEDEDGNEVYNTNEIFIALIDKEKEYKEELKMLKGEDINEKSSNMLVDRLKNRLMYNYVMEYTPLGNVIMRYNNNKGSFEYYSNSTIPYRYLEVVGRKYVLTYKCKKLFVDLEEELSKFQEQEQVQVQKQFHKMNNKNMIMKKNRNDAMMPLQMPLVNVKGSNSNKLVLKERSNRYTWEGRITNFNPLQKIDRKIVDKKYGLSYADFKKMQMNKIK
jgi:hypothetical protein